MDCRVWQRNWQIHSKRFKGDLCAYYGVFSCGISYILGQYSILSIHHVEWAWFTFQFLHFLRFAVLGFWVDLAVLAHLLAFISLFELHIGVLLKKMMQRSMRSCVCSGMTFRPISHQHLEIWECLLMWPCEDGQQVEAHKVVLISFSPFFKNLLQMNKHPHPLIYMRGVKSEDLVTMTDFIYHGKANVYHENLESFWASTELRSFNLKDSVET